MIALAFFIYFSSLPEVKAEGEELENNSDNGDGQTIFSFPYLWIGFVALFLYVGVEVMAGDIIQIYGKAIGIPLVWQNILPLIPC